MLKRFLLVLTCIFLKHTVQAQTLIKLTLFDAVKIAQTSSLDYKIAMNSYKSSFWNYQNFRSSFLPKLGLKGVLPQYYRTINAITLPAGEVAFVSQNVSTSSAYLNVTQNIPLTGGILTAGSSLSRIDNFGNYRNRNYTSIPLSLNYTQGSLFYNDYKWQKKIEPLRLTESRKAFAENMESISYNTVNQFFDLLLTSVRLKLDKQNLKNIDTLLKITQARFDIGTVQLNELLQIKLSFLNAKTALNNSAQALDIAQQNICHFLNIEPGFDVQSPDSLVFFRITKEAALEKARSNRKYITEFQRRLIEAQQAIAKTKAETGPQITLSANIGLAQTSNTITQAYQNLLSNQLVTVGFDLPLLDWGVNKSNRKRAEENLALETNRIKQENLSYEQEIISKVLNWNKDQEQLTIALEALKIAEQRYEVARQKYALGTLNFTEFNNSQLDKDNSAIEYINNLKDFWNTYFYIRKITLFDFSTNLNIEYPVN